MLLFFITKSNIYIVHFKMSTKFMFDYIDQMYFSYYYLHVNKIIYNNSVQNMKIQMLIAYIYFVEFDLKHYSIRKVL